MRILILVSLCFGVVMLLSWPKVGMGQSESTNAAAKAHNAKMKVCRATYEAKGNQLELRVRETGSRVNQARSETQAANNAAQQAIGNFGRLLGVSRSATATKQDVAATKAASEFMDRVWANGRAKNQQAIEVFETTIAAREAFCRHVAQVVAAGCSLMNDATCRREKQIDTLERFLAPIRRNSAMYQGDWRQEGDRDFGSPAETKAGAKDPDKCAIAKENARAGYEAYLPTFEKAVRFLKSNFIEYEKTGLGQSGSSKFSINASFDQAKSDDTAPLVLITPLAGSHDTQFGYVLIGSLTSSIYHSDCIAPAGLSVFGHTWVKTINANTNSTQKVMTSLSAAGVIANGYHAGLASYQTGFESETYIIKIEDFGTGAQAQRYQKFMDIVNTLPYGGTY